MHGAGLRGVALLASSEFELKHFMLARLLKRAGASMDYFHLGLSNEPGLLATLQRKNIKTIVALGEPALRDLLGESDIVRWRGRTVAHPHLSDVWIVPTFAPSKLLSHRSNDDDDDDIMRHPPRFHGIWMRDIHHALEVAEKGFKRSSVNYLLDPPAARFAQFADEYEAALAADSETMLSWDIETYYKQKHAEDDEELEVDQLEGEILRVSFCFKVGYAVSVPWTPTYEPTIRRLLRTKGAMVVWNGSTFDVPVVRAVGYEVLGQVMDFMDAYHLWQSDLPKGLEWVTAEATDLLPWKHLSSAEPAHYSAIDADAALRNAIYIKDQLQRAGMWDLFLRHVVELMPILDAAGTRGNLMDVEKREEIRAKLLKMKQELADEAQAYVPRELLPRKLYKTEPDGIPPEGRDLEPCLCAPEPLTLAGWDIVYEPEQVKFCSVCGQPASNKTEHFKGSVGPLNPKTGKPTRIANPCKVAKGEIVLRSACVPRYYQLLPFNLGSSDQLMAYMRHFGHPVGQNKKDASKDTADKGHLKTLVKKFGAKFPIYSLAIQYSAAAKTIGTYTPEPDAEGFLHTQYVNSPSTWRFGSRKVKHGTQIQNWGKREENKYAKEARRQIIARPGRKLVQIDSSAVEAVMQGYYMNDPKYMETASQSIHAWLACMELGLEFTPQNVELVKSKHEKLYLEMKVVNYLTNFGGGAKLMTDTYPELFPTKKHAEAAQERIYAILPTLKAYHHAVRFEAHTKTYLETPWGYRHWYYDVFKPSWDSTIKLSKDGKRCVAFKPQNSNAAFQKDNLLLIGQSKFGEFLPTNASVHDSCCLDCPNELVDEAVEFLTGVFTRPIPQMHNLKIGAEVEVGENWAGFDPVDNPKGMQRVHKVIVDHYTMEQTESGLKAAA